MGCVERLPARLYTATAYLPSSLECGYYVPRLICIFSCIAFEKRKVQATIYKHVFFCWMR